MSSRTFSELRTSSVLSCIRPSGYMPHESPVAKSSRNLACLIVPFSQLFSSPRVRLCSISAIFAFKVLSASRSAAVSLYWVLSAWSLRRYFCSICASRFFRYSGVTMAVELSSASELKLATQSTTPFCCKPVPTNEMAEVRRLLNHDVTSIYIGFRNLTTPELLIHSNHGLGPPLSYASSVASVPVSIGRDHERGPLSTDAEIIPCVYR